MKTMLHFMLTIVLQGVFAFDAFAGDQKPLVDPSEHRAAIPEKLLELTPLGESFAEVAAVLNEKFASPNKTPAFDLKLVPSAGNPSVLVKSLQIDLGQYLTNPLTLTLPIPLPIIADTSATWMFNEKDVLVEIVVRKKLESEFDKD